MFRAPPRWAMSASGWAVPGRPPDPSLLPVAAAGGRLIGSLAYILAVLGRGTGRRGEKIAAACPGVDSQDLATILTSFQSIFHNLGPDRLSET